MVATTSKSRKEKDHKFKVALAEDLTEKLGIPQDEIFVPSSSFPGLDIRLSPAALKVFPFGIECKRQERLSIPEWWEQCRRNAEQEGLTPLLVFRRNHEGALAVIRWSDLLQLLTTTNQCQISSSPDHRWQNLAEGLTGGQP